MESRLPEQLEKDADRQRASGGGGGRLPGLGISIKEVKKKGKLRREVGY